MLRRASLCVVFFVILAGAAHAAPITFDFVFADPAGPARATGFITFEASLLPNPSSCPPVPIAIPGPEVLALEVTVSGASAGNGTFGLSDFEFVFWCTNNATLDLTTSLIGQPTPGDPWGSTSGMGGDFKLGGTTATAPDTAGTDAFRICANNSAADCMDLVSMSPRGTLASAPLVQTWGLAVLALIMLGLAAVRLRFPSLGK